MLDAPSSPADAVPVPAQMWGQSQRRCGSAHSGWNRKQRLVRRVHAVLQLPLLVGARAEVSVDANAIDGKQAGRSPAADSD